MTRNGVTYKKFKQGNVNLNVNIYFKMQHEIFQENIVCAISN